MTFLKFLQVLWTFWSKIQEAIDITFPKKEPKKDNDADWKQDIFNQPTLTEKEKDGNSNK